ncbi:hypothetical protein B0H12DRAFT_1232611 [Mycena haematopus]|nr:hypothetical protein B0H12DRAFT_1232611 [Mycena haematopus]
MARDQRKPLPDGFEESADGKQARCRACNDSRLEGEEPWMTRSSVRQHLATTKHAESVDRLAQLTERRLAEEQARLQYEFTDSADLQPAVEPQSSTRPSMFSPDDLPAADLLHSSEDPVSLDIPAPFDITPEDQAARLEYLAQIIRESAAHEQEFGEPELPDDPLEGLEDHNDVNENEAEGLTAYLKRVGELKELKNYFPWPSHLIMLLDAVLKMILWLLRELGVPHVPSYDQLRRIQQKTRQMSAKPVETRHVSTTGDIFYVNDIRESLAQHFSNPLVAPHLHLYPERTDGYVAETWQAQRWPEFGPGMLTPMYARGERHFYIDEVAELDTGELVLPLEWFTVRDRDTPQEPALLYTEYHEIEVDMEGWRVNKQTRHKVLASRLKRNYIEIVHERGQIHWLDEPRIMPHPMRKLADGDELYVVMANIWVDDVSGNRSKQYNKHLNEYFVLFASTSPTVSWTDQLGAIRTQVQATEREPVRTYNAHTNRPCRFIIRVPCEPADNPQQAEEALHLTGNALSKCRKCRAGGPAAETESDEGYHRLHFNALRSVAEKKEELCAQLHAAMRNKKDEIGRLQTATGTKDKITEFWIEQLLQKAQNAKAENPDRSEDSIAEELQQWLDSQPGDKMNPLFDLAGVDPTQDTPLEILHTVLLGIVKYAWHSLHTSMDEKQRDAFATRLYSTDISGLSIPPIRAAYIVQYRNNLIGKHFKSLMQTMPFHVHSLTDDARFTLVDTIGKLAARLWVHKIPDIDECCDDLEILIGNVLDAFGDVEPAKIINKVKIHLLVHTTRDVRRFGPTIRFSTEIHESFNTIFRLCSIFSNRASPSRDIARQLASMAWLKHVLSGGFWENEHGKWVDASPEVRRILQAQVVIQAHLGWAQTPKSTRPGTVRIQAKTAASDVAFGETLAASARSLVESGKPSSSSLWFPAKSYITRSGDDCRCRSWVVGQDDANNAIFGRVVELLVDREAHHKEIAATFRTNQGAKRKRTQEHRKATRDMNIRLGLTKPRAKKGTKKRTTRKRQPRSQAQSAAAEDDLEETEGIPEEPALPREIRARSRRGHDESVQENAGNDDVDSACGDDGVGEGGDFGDGDGNSDGDDSDSEDDGGEYQPDEEEEERSLQAQESCMTDTVICYQIHAK